MKKIDSSINKLNISYNNIDTQAEILNIKTSNLNKIISERLRYLQTILNIYIVADIPVKINITDDRPEKLIFYYNKLKPINADKLLNFKKPPIVNI